VVRLRNLSSSGVSPGLVSIEEWQGQDYIKLCGDGLAALNVYNMDERVSVDGQFEPFEDWQKNDQFGRCFVRSEDRRNTAVSHPATNARRAAVRFNAMLPAYYEALERVMKRCQLHEEKLAEARRNAEDIVRESDGVYQIECEKYENAAVHLASRGRGDGFSDRRAPAADDMVVTAEGVKISTYGNGGWTMPLPLAICIVRWMAVHKYQPTAEA